MDAKIYLMPEALVSLTDDGLNIVNKPGDFILFHQFNYKKYIDLETFDQLLISLFIRFKKT
jgi:hypothetical protein